ncbi:hypothetical protein [Cellulomonas septica]|uniref:Uncharacterized protein n=1 Tax=Cellulomonas septica TaxID=285080 RepID=A0ABX1K1G5_9CELL|nr:hypothetical protein [Cellulomonas septica]NKY40112.1 hypothetical protein [Cellulomonas septica]
MLSNLNVWHLVVLGVGFVAVLAVLVGVVAAGVALGRRPPQNRPPEG